MRRYLHSILFLLTSALSLFSQSTLLVAQDTASLNGYVKDAETGETLIGANIALEDTRKGTSTNSSGYYSITNLEPGEYTVLASYIGYETYREDITLEEGSTLRLDVEMAPEGIQLDEIVVRSEEELEEQKDIGTAQINTQLINDLPTVFEADVFRSLQLLPGVKAASDFSSGLYVRGGGPDQTLILLDRTTVYNPTHFFGFFSTFNPDAVKDVRLYKGGYPAEYGGRLGSVLTVYNKDGNRNEFGGSATAGLLASRAMIEGPYSKGSYMLAVRRSTLEPVLAALQQVEDNIPESFYFLDVNGKINFDASRDDRLSLAFYSGNDNISFPFEEDANIGLRYGNRTLSGTWTHIFSDKLFGNFTATGSNYFNYPEFEIGGTPFERENNIYDYSLKGDLEYLLGNNHELKTGFWGGNMTLKLSDRFDNEDTFSSRIQTQYGSWYLQDTWRPGERWKIIGGIRYNYFDEGTYSRLEPRLSTEFRPFEELRLQAAYGRYNQFLTLITNEAFSGFDTWLTTDRGVPPSYGDQFVAGFKSIPLEGFGLDFELYYRTMNDLFELDPFTADVAGRDYDELFRFGDGYAYGAELFFEKQTGNFTGFLGYTFGITRRKFPGYNQPIGGGAARYYPPKYDRTHDLNLVLSYEFSSRWKVSSVFNYATGQAYTQPAGRTQIRDVPWGSVSRNTFTVGNVNASRLPGYHRLDFSASRNGTFFKLADAEWQFQLINVYSHRNVWFYQFDFDDNPVDRSEVPLLPVVPSISYTVDF